MAWIKMRGALLDHPKTIAVSRELHSSKAFREWLTPGGSGPMNGQLVGDAALRCVTVGLLLRVWSVSREHGKFVGNDLVLEHSEVADLDQMAGAPGVGAAMQAVGWALAAGGVTLPNFKEFNVPMTPAEKQREYRRRHGAGNAAGHGDVTTALPNVGNVSGTREEGEKSREGQSPARAKALAPGTSRSVPGKRRSKAPTLNGGTAPPAVAAGLTAGGNGSGEAVPGREVELSVFGSDQPPVVGVDHGGPDVGVEAVLGGNGELVLSGDPPAGNGEDKTPLQRACSLTWLAYAAAYERRWGVAPVRSTIANAHILAFCKSVPQDEAPDIAAFFLLSNNAFYVSRKHDLSALRRDAAGLRTEWATGRQVTQAEARSGDKTAAVGNVFQKLIEEGRRFEEEERRRHASEA